jgi:hypothetical protein
MRTVIAVIGDITGSRLIALRERAALQTTLNIAITPMGKSARAVTDRARTQLSSNSSREVFAA